MSNEIKLLSPKNITQGFRVKEPEDVLEELDEMMRQKANGAFLGLEKDPDDYNKDSYGGVITIIPISDTKEQLWVIDVPEHDSYAQVTRTEVETVIKRWFTNEPLNLPLQKFPLMISRPDDLKPQWAR